MEEHCELRDNIILYDREGKEIKNWQALVEYAAAQPVGSAGIPLIPDYYAAPSGRITRVSTLPLLLWLAALAFRALRRRSRRKKKLPKPTPKPRPRPD